MFYVTKGHFDKVSKKLVIAWVKNYLNDDCYENNRSYLIDNFLVSINTDDNGTNAYMDFYIFENL